MHALSCYVHVTADLYYAVEFISVIKASRLVTIEGENQSPTITSSTHNIDDPLPPPWVQLSSYILVLALVIITYMSYNIHIRCICLTQWHRVDVCISHNITVISSAIHFLCILYILDVSISHNVTVLSSTIHLCILYILDVSISHNVTVISIIKHFLCILYILDVSISHVTVVYYILNY